MLSTLWNKLRKKKYRESFVAAHVKQSIPFQIRALMDKHELTQAELAERAGLTQGAISRATRTGNLTINTCVRIAAGFDVAFVGRFVPFSELERWAADMNGLARAVPTFEQEDAQREKPRTDVHTDATARDARLNVPLRPLKATLRTDYSGEIGWLKTS